MNKRVHEKARAIELRKKGFSYNEILEQVDVAKSSLSLWLSTTPLSANERRLLKSRTSSRITLGRLKAAAAHRANREKRDEILFEEIRTLFQKHRHEALFLLGIALYWAEGTHRGTSFAFTNSDPEMVNIMVDWTEKYFQLPRRLTKVRLYLHKPFAHEHHEEFWAKRIRIPVTNFKKTVFKPTGKLVKKRPNYHGCIRVEITNGLADRKMSFLTSLLLDDYKKWQ